MRRGLRVGVILVDRHGQVLLQRRDSNPAIPNPGRWSIPGGAVHDGEAVEAAARREFLEETGYRIDELWPLVIEDCNLPDGTPVRRMVFWTRYDGVQEVCCYEGQEVRFVAPRELLSLQLSPGHGPIIDAALEAARPTATKGGGAGGAGRTTDRGDTAVHLRAER